MSKKQPADDADKWELIRRLRYGALLKLFRHRWGNVLPDDDAGRDDLWLLVTNVSLAAAEPKKKMHHVIEMWAPWMSEEERSAYVKHVWGLDIYERTLTALELGRRLGLTNAEREALKLWPFLPIDRKKSLPSKPRRESAKGVHASDGKKASEPGKPIWSNWQANPNPGLPKAFHAPLITESGSETGCV